ncbi:hypothetical protein PAPYR_3 [Paratrimastix pyriformis]|uniref:Secreted protein n=1 Tax=Paratrimastix pyriformis TaxID=342808 RepID=A0ABQ8UZ23_9EUKA|nr:hypothetical protein PAPYR_3 [Paratrimastix pyriformis]
MDLARRHLHVRFVFFFFPPRFVASFDIVRVFASSLTKRQSIYSPFYSNNAFIHRTPHRSVPGIFQGTNFFRRDESNPFLERVWEIEWYRCRSHLSTPQ